ncbi:MAG: type II toxin-antitoxin system VapC family toxin [Intrasporangium sp.]|uniref:type II toxin-antitoxin system VapC family toxin n=1 Tax=Intrasporangium sp. TaxID=1925024 RepID=UPI002649A502|nr:type II toxin-antitoxin system VapC family toxin [Intrasporangium sp.]MDN5794833.1 type II toxin-antitoxin system VapC family toxin [Intrasporangium sp.]
MGVTGGRFLLDIHVLLWLLGDPARVPVETRDQLADRRTEILVSAASALEVATKVRIGRLHSGAHLVDTWADRLRDIAATDLPITSHHALLAGSLVWGHRDPFDRLLVAQALVENLALVTTDTAMKDVVGLRLHSW